MKHILSILALATLAACGGGGGDAPATQASTTQQPQDRLPVGQGPTSTPSAVDTPPVAITPSGGATAAAPTTPAAPVAQAPTAPPVASTGQPAPAPVAQAPQQPQIPSTGTPPDVYPDQDPNAPQESVLCGPNSAGLMFPCDPRWPVNHIAPTHGATQNMVDGYNQMQEERSNWRWRCIDGRVYDILNRFRCFEAPTPEEQAALDRAGVSAPTAPQPPFLD